MRIIIVTQKLDKDDWLLGFFYYWVDKLAKRLERIYVIALEKGRVDLPDNVFIYSLGKERGYNRVRLFFNFNLTLGKILSHSKIDIIFIHMCPVYSILSIPYTALFKIPQLIWYAHKEVDLRLKIGHFLADRVLTPSKESFRIESKKVIVTGHGIDVNKFNPVKYGTKLKINNKKIIILSVGRISPIKNYETLIKAAGILVNQRNVRDLEFQIIGDIVLKSQKRYLHFLKDMVSNRKLEDYFQLVGPVSYTQMQNYYQNCDLFVSTSNTGSLDKAALEAVACGKIIVACNDAFRDILGSYSEILSFGRKNFRQLADKMHYLLNMDETLRQKIIKDLRDKVCQDHNLDTLVYKLTGIFRELH